MAFTVNHTTTRRLKYSRTWFPGVIQVAPQEAVTLTPLIYPANSLWSVGRPQLILHCEGVPTDLTLLGSSQLYSRTVITLAGIACIIMREVYATIGESIYPNPSFLSRDFPEASGRLLRNLKEFTFQDMAN